MSTRADVAIIGGGLAGLSLALQLRRRVPTLDVRVIDRGRRPAQERTSTVGESFAELGSHYLREVVGLADHLDADELPKFGLRFFIGDAWDFEDRYELGVLDPVICELRDGRLLGLPLRTHQVDRARLENEMAARAVRAGVRLVEETFVERVELDPAGHRLFLSGATNGPLEAAWVVSASGAIPGLPVERRSLGHRLRAAWFRVEGHLDVGAWSSNPAYFEHTLPGLRRLSTNHLMGRGYWIWLIPLSSGVTSVGVVSDPELVPALPDTFSGLSSWIEAHDPRLAHELASARPVDPAPHVRETDAFVTRSFHAERWATVGGAAAFVDVLYSPGADLIALGNTLLTGLVERDHAGGRLPGACAVANRIFEGFVEGLAEVYRGQYRSFGVPEVVATKAVWDSTLYFGFNTLLFRHGLSGDARFLARIQPELLTLRSLQARVQGRFRRGDAAPLFPAGNATVEWGRIDWLMSAYYGAEKQPDEAGVIRHLRSTLASLEEVGRRIEGVT